MTNEEKRGLDSLKKRRDRDDIVVYHTDKSSRFTIDTLVNYRDACKPHTENDIVVTQEIHEKVQKKGNAHSAFWVRILRVGDNIGEKTTSRIKSNMVVQDCTLAPLYGLRKDHKSGVDTNNKPPIRPVCGAVVAYSRKLSHIVSYILNEV